MSNQAQSYYEYPQLHKSASAATDDETIEVTQEDLANTMQYSAAVPATSASTSTAAAPSANKEAQNFLSFVWNKACLRCILPLLLIGGIVYGAMRAMGIEVNRESIPSPIQDFLFSRDGWEGLTAADLPRWNTRGSGVLKLEMLNALEDDWQPYFTQSVEEWNTGTPDVVELTVTRVDPNSGCDFTKGKFAVCAGDYGSTGFHGVNEILVFGGSITASVAKLNEHYLALSTQARKQYTMCHEIGHGFGLPHSDENFYNLNLGNCMDYTDRPWTNTQPDDYTFELLQEIYGVPSKPVGSAEQGDGEVISQESTSSASSSFLRSGGDDEDEEDDKTIPESIRVRANEAASNLETKFADEGASDEWVQLHRDDLTAAFQIDLGDGFSLQAHFLLTSDE